MALGARPSDILGGVVQQGLMMVGVGMALGVAGALGIATLLESFLVGVSAFDPLAIAGWCAVMVGVAIAASYLPARRATRIDPAAVLTGRE
jgi:ABC-type antimicrobial peptide transport system permease subunit